MCIFHLITGSCCPCVYLLVPWQNHHAYASRVAFDLYALQVYDRAHTCSQAFPPSYCKVSPINLLLLMQKNYMWMGRLKVNTLSGDTVLHILYTSQLSAEKDIHTHIGHPFVGHRLTK